MRNRLFSVALFLLLAAALVATPADALAQSTITIVNGNAPGVGFNDPTPAAPVGGNTGTTLGEQRLKAFQHAAGIWGATLASNVEIKILATFEPLTCNATQRRSRLRRHPLHLPRLRWAYRPSRARSCPTTWYHSALANKLAGLDLLPPRRIRSRPPAVPISGRASTSNLGNTGCLTGVGWYLGFDTNHGTQIDLVTVLLHEFAHGLGFSQFASVTTRRPACGLPGHLQPADPRHVLRQDLGRDDRRRAEGLRHQPTPGRVDGSDGHRRSSSGSQPRYAGSDA